MDERGAFMPLLTLSRHGEWGGRLQSTLKALAANDVEAAKVLLREALAFLGE